MINLDNFWNEILNALSIKLSALDYTTWIEPLVPLCTKDSYLYMVAPTVNSKLVINEHYIKTMNDTLNSLYPHSIINKIEVVAECEKHVFSNDESNIPVVKNINSDSHLVKSYTFENFVVGKSNEFAFHAAQSVAKNPNSNHDDTLFAYNPLFIYSGVGLGKTHLLHAIGNYIIKEFTNLKVLYTTAENLTNDFVKALSNSDKSGKEVFNVNAFREKYQSFDVLMIDDIQFLENKSGSQEVVFNIFNHLYLSGKQIVITSDRPPQAIPTLEDRLISRFKSGLLIEMTKPNLETRIAIVRKKMSFFNLNLDDEIVYFIAENIDTNIRDLEGHLKLISLSAKLSATMTPTIEMVKNVINDNLSKKEGVDSSDILEAVSRTTKISLDKIIGGGRKKEYVAARDIAIYLIREYLNLPFASIGQLLNGRDHSTIAYSYDKISSNIKIDTKLANIINDLTVYLNI